MNCRRLSWLCVLLILIPLAVGTSSVFAQPPDPVPIDKCPSPCPTWEAPEPWFSYGVPATLLFGLALAVLATMSALRGTRWSLADALSEEAEVSADPPTPIAPAPVSSAVPVPPRSSSRCPCIPTTYD